MLLLTDFFLRHLHLLRHVRRSRHPLNTQQMKSLVRTSQAVQLTTHRPKRCLNPVVCDNVVARPDIGLLFHLGVNGQILMHFAAFHQIEWQDYLQRMRDGIAEHGPVREGVYAMTTDLDERVAPVHGEEGA